MKLIADIDEFSKHFKKMCKSYNVYGPVSMPPMGKNLIQIKNYIISTPDNNSCKQRHNYKKTNLYGSEMGRPNGSNKTPPGTDAFKLQTLEWMFMKTKEKTRLFKFDMDADYRQLWWDFPM